MQIEKLLTSLTDLVGSKAYAKLVLLFVVMFLINLFYFGGIIAFLGDLYAVITQNTSSLILVSLLVAYVIFRSLESPSQGQSIQNLRAESLIEKKIQDQNTVIANLEKKINALTDLSDDNKAEMIQTLKQEMLDISANEASDSFIESVTKKVKVHNEDSTVGVVFLSTQNRLLRETKQLGSRANLNLTIGILTTLAGLSMLYFFVSEIQTTITKVDWELFFVEFLPRISLVILIEVFAYFFLKLYKTTLVEIKYFQNELTNLESRWTAFKLALVTQDKHALKSVIETLSKTERNFVLEKGQSTTDLEKSKIDQQNVASLSSAVSALVKDKKR